MVQVIVIITIGWILLSLEKKELEWLMEIVLMEYVLELGMELCQTKEMVL